MFIKHSGELATPTGKAAKKGSAQGEITTLHNAYIIIENGVITDVGSGEAPEYNGDVIDAEGRLVTPGLVDCHTHLVFGGWREAEFPLKLKGVPYLEIVKGGGGILSTLTATHKDTKEELTEKGREILDEMLSLGVTTVEAKSGYGLDLENEIKQLEVTRELSKTHCVDVVSTFMGAHAVPEEYKGNSDGYVDLVCNEMIPYVAKEGLAEFCDVFCESGVFDPVQSEKILNCAKQYGLVPKIHADEIDPIGGSQLAGKVGAISAEHLIAAPDEGLEAMSKAGTIAALLPATSFYLGKDFARARDMINLGIPVAISTDFNPGSSPNLSLQLAMCIGCYRYKLSPEEVLTAVTLNAAAALGNRAETIGSIEVGKKADIAIWNAPNLSYIFYRYGSNLVDTVIKGGKVVAKNS